MGIRLKILGILLLVLISYVILNQGVYRLVILPSYADLEREEATKDVNRCLDALDREIHYLDTVTHDWAAWDDTYDFVERRNPDYLQSNLLPQTFLDNRINAIFIVDINKKKIWGEVRDLNSGSLIDLPAFSAAALKADPVLFETRDIEGGVSGIINTSAGPLVLASRPISTSDHRGPVRGHLIMARFLDADYVRMLRGQTHIDHVYLSVSEKAPVVEPLLNGENGGAGIVFNVEDENTLAGYALLRDIYGNPALLLKTTLYRYIYAKGSDTVHLALVSVGLAGMVILAMMVLLMNRTVIHPLVELTRRVVAIKDSAAAPPPLFDKRKDEIGMLCREFSSMINQLKTVNDGLAGVNTRLRHEIRERKSSAKRALVDQEKLRVLSSQLTLIEERERRRIAADLHDRISQSLALTQIKLGLLTQSNPSCCLVDELQEIENEIESIIQGTRTLTFEISPAILYEIGVEAAIEWIAETMMPKYGLQITVHRDQNEGDLTDSLRVLIFRSVRELLLNIVKHAAARQVTIRLTRSPQRFQVVVEDDGVGFNALDAWPENQKNEGFGLFSIKERLSAIGGAFDIHSESGAGTRVTLTVPIRT